MFHFVSYRPHFGFQKSCAVFPYFCCAVLSQYAVGAAANFIHIANKLSHVHLKHTSLVSLTFFCLLKCCRYHSAMFPAGTSFIYVPFGLFC